MELFTSVYEEEVWYGMVRVWYGMVRYVNRVNEGRGACTVHVTSGEKRPGYVVTLTVVDAT